MSDLVLTPVGGGLDEEVVFAEESFASYSAYPGDEPERWERVRFGDSVEISWRQSDTDPTSERKVKQLLDKAAKIFK